MNENRNNSTENDATGEIMSWVIVIIAMFAVLPVGLFMLFRKLSNSANKGSFTNSSRGSANTSTGAYNTHGAYNAHGAYNPHTSASAAGHPYAPSGSQASAYTQQPYTQNAQNVQNQSGAANNAANNAAQNAGQNVGHYTAQNAAQNAGQYTSQSTNNQNNAANNTAANKAAPNAAAQNTAAQSNKARSYAAAAGQTGATRYDGAGYRYVNVKKPKKQKRLEKKTGKAISVMLLLSSVVMMFAGVQNIVSSSISIWGNAGSNWLEFIMGALYILGAFVLFGVRNVVPKRISRYKRYYNYVAGRDLVLISDIALSTGNSIKKVTRELQGMINEGYLGPDAYLDSELECLVLSEEAAVAARRVARDGFATESFNEPQKEEKLVNQYMEIILELRDLNEKILDAAISAKIDRIEELTAKIFRIVEEEPAKLPQIRRFMNYYLPTTLKLLHSYATLEKQGEGGENITTAKENIGRILDTLAKGYEQQLDQLFQSDVIDIAADINVLENLMQQDGLANDKSTFKTMEGTM